MEERYTMDDILKVIGELSDTEKKTLFETYKVTDLYYGLNDTTDALKRWCETTENTVRTIYILATIIYKLYSRLEEMQDDKGESEERKEVSEKMNALLKSLNCMKYMMHRTLSKIYKKKD